jgi:hypothetical protein
MILCIMSNLRNLKRLMKELTTEILGWSRKIEGVRGMVKRVRVVSIDDKTSVK